MAKKQTNDFQKTQEAYIVIQQKETIEVKKKTPAKKEIEGFWKPIFEDQKQHQESQLITTIIDKNNNKSSMAEMDISEQKIKKKII